MKSVVSHRSGGLLSFGFLFLIWSASSGLYAVMQQLNVVYGVKEDRSFVRTRAIAILLTLSFFVLIVGALGLVIFGGKLQAFLGDHLGWSSALLLGFAVLRWAIIVAAIQLAFALVYYLGPNVRQPFVLVTPGSVFATFGLLIASLFVTGWVILLGGEVNDLARREQAGA